MIDRLISILYLKRRWISEAVSSAPKRKQSNDDILDLTPDTFSHGTLAIFSHDGISQLAQTESETSQDASSED